MRFEGERGSGERAAGICCERVFSFPKALAISMARRLAAQRMRKERPSLFGDESPLRALFLLQDVCELIDSVHCCGL